MEMSNKRNKMSGLNRLIKACKKNDRRAQIELYDLFAKTMYSTCYRLLKSTADAEDAMQEAFLSAFVKIDTFRNEVPFDAWLRRIVINKSLDALRKKKELFTEISNEIADDTTTHENPDFIKNLRNQLMSELENLPEGYRVIVSLYYFEGYDHDEISQILNISPSTSRSQLTRAKQKLIRRLNPKTNN